jgi:hypothetical protein
MMVAHKSRVWILKEKDQSYMFEKSLKVVYINANYVYLITSTNRKFV